MSSKPDYVRQLAELYETYTGKELEQILGVTVRSMQNYLKDDSPTVPGRDVIRKIREAYTKHQNEGNIDAPQSSGSYGVEESYKDKYIKMLEQRIEDQNRRLQAMEDKIMKYLSSETAEAYFQSLLALANTTLDELLDHRSALEKKEVKTLKKAANTRYDAYRLSMIDSGK